MAFYLVNSLKSDDVHGTDNTKKTACGIKYATPDAANLFALGKEMTDIKQLTCARCKEILAMKMIKESNKQMAQERKEERKKSKQAAKSVDYIPAPETKTSYAAPRPVQKNLPPKVEKENSKPKEDFTVNGEFIPKSLRKYGNDNPFGTKKEETANSDVAEQTKDNVQEAPAEQAAPTPAVAPINIPGIDIVSPAPTGFVSEVENQEAKPTPTVAPINIPGIDIVSPAPTGFVSEVEKQEAKPTPTVAPINIPGIDIVSPAPTGFVSEVENQEAKPTPTVAPINIPGIDIVSPAPTGFVSEVEKQEAKPMPTVAPINIPGIDIVSPAPTGFVSEVEKQEAKPTPTVAPINIPGIDIVSPAPEESAKAEESAADMIDFTDFEEFRPKKKENKPLDFDDLDDFIIGTPLTRKSAPVVNTTPAMPEIPSAPVVNTTPAMPEISSVPVVNTTPAMPEIPSVPVVNTTPAMPEIPSVPVVNPTHVAVKRPVVAPLDKSVAAAPISDESAMADVEKPVITPMDTAAVRPNIRMTTSAVDDDIIAVPSFVSTGAVTAEPVEDAAAPIPVITSLEDVEKALNKMQGIETDDEPAEEEPEVVVPAFKEYKPMSKTEIEKRKLERIQKQEPDRPLSRAEQKRLEKEEKKKAKIDAEFAKDMAKRGITSDSMRDRRRR